MLVLPRYYDNNGRQPRHVIEAYNMHTGFNLGSVLKYVCRAGKKTPDALGDLQKALTYVEFELDPVKKRMDALPRPTDLARELGLRGEAVEAFFCLLRAAQGSRTALETLHKHITNMIEDLPDDATEH